MKAFSFFIILFSILNNVLGQNKNIILTLDTTITFSKKPTLGWSNLNKGDIESLDEEGDENSSEDKVKIFSVDTISLSLYKKFKSAQIVYLNPDSNKITRTDTSFIIKTKTKSLNFRADTKDYSEFNYYLGYIKPLQLFAINYVNGSNEYASLVMIDQVSGKVFNIESPSDYPLENISISKDTSVLATFVNNLYNDYSYIIFFNINRKTDKYSLVENCGLEIPNCRINDLIWIGQSKFVVAITEVIQNSQEEKKYYLRIKINKNNNNTAQKNA